MNPHPMRLGQFTETMSDATIIEWLVKVGDKVSQGDPLVIIETDKASIEVPAPVDGFILKIYCKPNDIVEIGQELVLIGPADAKVEENISEAPKGSRPESEAEVAVNSSVSAISIPSSAQSGPARVRISPLARRVAQEENIDINELKGTGAYGTIVKEDVIRLVNERQKEKPAEPEKGDITAEYRAIPLVGMRRTIAERMSLSRRTAADVTTIAEVEVSALHRLRNIIPVSYTVFVVKAAAEALHEFPEVNAAMKGDEIRIYKDMHISVAMALENGLVTPVVRNADKKSVLEIASEIGQVSEKARSKGLSPKELEGGTFTVTNSGVFGSLMFTPIINYPQAATMGMGKVFKTPVVDDNDNIVVGRIMHLCLSYDHRVIDGKPAVKFLQAVKNILENPNPVFLMTAFGSPERALSEKKSGK